MTPIFPSPTAPAASRAEVHLRYLEYFRAVLVAKLAGLSDAELRSGRLPSGWAPLELLKHVAHVEARWLEWGFEGRDVVDPWADRRNGRWYVCPEESLADIVSALEDQAVRSRAVVEAHALDDVGQPGEQVGESWLAAAWWLSVMGDPAIIVVLLGGPDWIVVALWVTFSVVLWKILQDLHDCRILNVLSVTGAFRGSPGT